MYTSTVEKIECKMLFTRLTRGTGASFFNVSSSSDFTSSFCSFLPTWFCKFRNHDPDKFQFQSQVHLFQINVIVPIRLKFKIYAVSIEWGSRIDFLFMGRQDIVNYWDFPSKISRNCHRRLVPKIIDKYWRMFVKKSLRHRLVCFAGFVGMPPLTLLSHLRLCSSFPTVCFSTFFAAALKFFLPHTT